MHVGACSRGVNQGSDCGGEGGTCKPRPKTAALGPTTYPDVPVLFEICDLTSVCGGEGGRGEELPHRIVRIRGRNPGKSLEECLASLMIHDDNLLGFRNAIVYS